MQKLYPVGRPMKVWGDVIEDGEVVGGVVEGVIVAHFENRIGHESGVVVKADGQFINVPFSFLHEDGTGSAWD